MPGPYQVINALNQIVCSCCPIPELLIVRSQPNVFVLEQLAATIVDFAPMANITPFGPSAVLTASAAGGPTPCAPTTTSPWTPGSMTTTYEGMPAPRIVDTLVCDVGSVIKVVNPGQFIYSVE